MDFDRFNNSLTKLRDKKEKSLSDEKNLYKVTIACLDITTVRNLRCSWSKISRLLPTIMKT